MSSLLSSVFKAGTESDTVATDPISANDGDTQVRVTGPLAQTYHDTLKVALAKTEEAAASGTETVATEAPVAAQVAREVSGELAETRGDVEVTAVADTDITPETALEMTAAIAKSPADEVVTVIDATQSEPGEVVSPEEIEVSELKAPEEGSAPAEAAEASGEEDPDSPLAGLSPAVESYAAVATRLGARVFVARRVKR